MLISHMICGRCYFSHTLLKMRNLAIKEDKLLDGTSYQSQDLLERKVFHSYSIGNWDTGRALMKATLKLTSDLHSSNLPPHQTHTSTETREAGHVTGDRMKALMWIHKLKCAQTEHL